MVTPDLSILFHFVYYSLLHDTCNTIIFLPTEALRLRLTLLEDNGLLRHDHSRALGGHVDVRGPGEQRALCCRLPDRRHILSFQHTTQLHNNRGLTPGISW